jgi:hypothetical protein
VHKDIWVNGQLAKANEALRGCLDALASVHELDDFLGQVMATMTRQLAAVISTLRMLNLDQNRLTVELAFQDDQVLSPVEARFPEAWPSGRRTNKISLRSWLDQPRSPVCSIHTRPHRRACVIIRAQPAIGHCRGLETDRDAANVGRTF